MEWGMAWFSEKGPETFRDIDVIVRASGCHGGWTSAPGGTHFGASEDLPLRLPHAMGRLGALHAG